MALLPLDGLKVKAQANPRSLAGRGALEILTSEGRGLYRGAAWTAARNAPGSFALFGGASLVKEHMFLLDRPENATLFQTFVASVAGAVSRWAGLVTIGDGCLCSHGCYLNASCGIPILERWSRAPRHVCRSKNQDILDAG